MATIGACGQRSSRYRQETCRRWKSLWTLETSLKVLDSRYASSLQLQGLVHVWEYQKGAAQTGSIFAIDSGDFKPHTRLVEGVLRRHRARFEKQACTVKLPPIELLQPNAVFHREVCILLMSSSVDERSFQEVEQGISRTRLRIFWCQVVLMTLFRHVMDPQNS